MKITEIKKEDNIKISKNSWTVKGENLKTKGVIRNIMPVMQLQFGKLGKLFEISKKLKQYGIEKFRGNIYIDINDNLYYPHHVTNFYEVQIARYGEPIVKEEYERHLKYEKTVDELRNCPILTVIDCYIL